MTLLCEMSFSQAPKYYQPKFINYKTSFKIIIDSGNCLLKRENAYLYTGPVLGTLVLT